MIDLQEKKVKSLISILWQPFKRKVEVMEFHYLHVCSVDCSVVSSSDPPVGYTAGRRVPEQLNTRYRKSLGKWKHLTSVIYIIWEERVNRDLLKTKMHGISYFFLCFKSASLQPYVVCPVKRHICYFSLHVHTIRCTSSWWNN